MYLCICECGRQSRLEAFKLFNGISKSCVYCCRKGRPNPNKGKKGLWVAWNKGIKGSIKPNSGSFKKGLVPWNKDKKRPEITGPNHYLWREDREQVDLNKKRWYSKEYAEWRTEVFMRDNWKCRIADQKCKGQVEVHHILPWRDYVELRFNTKNGITLCHAHHPRKRSEEAKLSPYFKKLVAET